MCFYQLYDCPVMYMFHTMLGSGVVLYKWHVGNRGADTLVQQAQSWESKGEYLRSIECYARVTADVTSDQNVLQRCWVKVSFFCFSAAHSVCELLHIT